MASSSRRRKVVEYALGAVLVMAATLVSVAVVAPGGAVTGRLSADPTTSEGPTTASTAPLPIDGPPSDVGTWTQVFGDEFEGPSIDTTKWRTNRYGGSADNAPFNPEYEGAFYSPRNVSVLDGQAVLTVQPEPKTLSGVAYTYSSGMLSSQDSFSVQDGEYVEARIRIPTGEGLWPAFWTMPSDRWPPETDILEFFDTSKPQLPTFIYHFPGPVGANGELSVLTYGNPAVDYRDSWHTYGLLRTGGRLVPYLDGVPYPGAGVSAGADDLPQFLMLNLAVYSGRTPTPGTQMRIDWVRVWHLS
jgi:beta-glucanase (GH16 family)